MSVEISCEEICCVEFHVYTFKETEALYVEVVKSDTTYTLRSLAEVMWPVTITGAKKSLAK